MLSRCRPLLEYVLDTFHVQEQSHLTVLALGRAQHALHFLVQGARLRDFDQKLASIRMVTKDRARAEEPKSDILDIDHGKPGFLRFPELARSLPEVEDGSSTNDEHGEDAGDRRSIDADAEEEDKDGDERVSPSLDPYY